MDAYRCDMCVHWRERENGTCEEPRFVDGVCILKTGRMDTVSYDKRYSGDNCPQWVSQEQGVEVTG